MQAPTLPSAVSASQVTAAASHSDRELAERIQRSDIFRDYQKAFEAATGLPLAIKPVGSFQEPLHGSRHANAFCRIMASQSKACAFCLEAQERMEAEGSEKAATVECFAGFSESTVPVRVGSRVIAYLQTGQILKRRPCASRFNTVLRELRSKGLDPDEKELKTAYFETQVVSHPRYESVLQLLSIFAMHLATLSNQLIVSEASTESQTISRARAFIAEHLADEISLGQVAKAAGMSVYYFCKVFKKEKGMTFTEYLARLRVESVKQMLLNPHKRISEAAYDAGFQSLSQFNRVFRHLAGETPSNYRDNLHRRGAGLESAPRLVFAA